MRKVLVSLAILSSIAGCSTQTAYINGRGGELAYSDMQTFFISGLAQTQTVNAAEICGGAAKVAKVERTVSFVNGLLGALTQGIYTPYDAKVYCIK